MDLRKRLFAILMSITMVFTYMPAMAFAAGEQTPAEKDPAAVEAQADGQNADSEETQDPEDLQEDQESDPDQGDALKADRNDSSQDDQVTEPDQDDSAQEDQASGSDQDLTDPAEAEEDISEHDSSEPGEVSAETSYSCSVELADDDELLWGYLNDGIRKKSAKERRKAARSARGTKLEGNNSVIYGILADGIRSVVDDDNVTSTVFTVGNDQLSFQQTQFTREEMEVESIYDSNGYLSEEVVSYIYSSLDFDQ